MPHPALLRWRWHRMALYRFDLDPAAPTASMGWRKVTDKPEQRDFVMTHNSDGSLGTFYSGAELVWEGATCTSDTTNFYRSDDQGASWTTVTSDKAYARWRFCWVRLKPCLLQPVAVPNSP